MAGERSYDFQEGQTITLAQLKKTKSTTHMEEEQAAEAEEEEKKEEEANNARNKIF